MSDTPETPFDSQNALNSFVPAEVEFKPEPAHAQPGQPPESLLGKRVAKARAHFALNVEALSRLTKLYDTHEGRGISPPSLARYESGDTLPSAREVRLLCEALGVSAQWLIFGEIDTSGETQQEQALLAALAAFVAMKKDDARIGDGSVSDMLKWGKDQARAKKLQEARRPQST
jgi:transcriptional regulator with XRE-family HTH domain